MKIIIEILTTLFTIVSINRTDILQNKWIKYSTNPVLGDINTGSLFDPHVIKVNDKYKMYVSIRNQKSIGISESIDGYNWSEPKVIFSPKNTSNFEYDINRATVLYKDNKYYMWYTGQKDGVSKIGFAISDDGYDFKRVVADAVLVPEYSWEKKSVMNPHVIYDNDEKIFKMWYSAGDIYEPDVLGYATSSDGIKWIKKETPVLTPNKDKNALDNFKIGGCDVHKIDNEYIMFYIGYTDINTGRIFVAKSKDGIKWIRYNYPIVESSKDSFDSESCYKPTAYYDLENKKWLLWYNGRTKDKEYIGLAYYNN